MADLPNPNHKYFVYMQPEDRAIAFRLAFDYEVKNPGAKVHVIHRENVFTLGLRSMEPLDKLLEDASLAHIVKEQREADRKYEQRMVEKQEYERTGKLACGECMAKILSDCICFSPIESESLKSIQEQLDKLEKEINQEKGE